MDPVANVRRNIQRCILSICSNQGCTNTFFVRDAQDVDTIPCNKCFIETSNNTQEE